jgi:hypothetical protein
MASFLEFGQDFPPQTQSAESYPDAALAVLRKSPFTHGPPPSHKDFWLKILPAWTVAVYLIIRAPGLFPRCAASSLSGGYQKQYF